MKTQDVPEIGRDSLMEELLNPEPVAYKVVRRKNSRAFKPATTDALQSFTYRIGKETKRDKRTSGPIAIFANPDDAIRFNSKYGDSVIAVLYTPSKEKSVWKKNPPSFAHSHGGYYAVSNGISERTEFPDGTILAESVYPLEIVA